MTTLGLWRTLICRNPETCFCCKSIGRDPQSIGPTQVESPVTIQITLTSRYTRILCRPGGINRPAATVRTAVAIADLTGHVTLARGQFEILCRLLLIHRNADASELVLTGTEPTFWIALVCRKLEGLNQDGADAFVRCKARWPSASLDMPAV
jgi:hypothetical protein